MEGRIKILIINANYYEDVSKNLCLGALLHCVKQCNLKETDYEQDVNDKLTKGVKSFCFASGDNSIKIEIDIVNVAGCLEIPLMLARQTGNGKSKYHGFVAVGCVIRGQTTHYDTVCNECNAGITKIAIEQSLVIGNAVLTTESIEQANTRARYWMAHHENKGGFAMRACLEMISSYKSYPL